MLSDPAKRKKYDEMRRYGRSQAPPGPAGGPGRAEAASNSTRRTLGFGRLGDLFSSIFGRRGEGRGEPDDEVETTVTIPFRVAALGGKVPIALGMTEVCPMCSGSGAAPGATISTCPECRGRGTVSFGQGGFAVNRPCPVCRGKGKVPSEPCPTCRGSGDVRTEKRLMITVPPGTDDGARMRLKGEGARGRGDIIVVFQVEPDRFFRREGLYVIFVVPINVMQAMLGRDRRQDARRSAGGPAHPPGRSTVRNLGSRAGHREAPAAAAISPSLEVRVKFRRT